MVHCRRSARVEDDEVPGLNKGAVDEGCVSVVDGAQWWVFGWTFGETGSLGLAQRVPCGTEAVAAK
jgi:hypothetical protein